MNILFSTLIRLSSMLGDMVHVSELVKNFAILGNNVHLIALDRGSVKIPRNVRFYQIIPPFGVRLQSLYSRYLIRKILKAGIDVVYERYDFIDLYGIRMGYSSDVPTILEVNGVPGEVDPSVAHRPTIRINPLVIKRFNMADKIVAVSEGIAKLYRSQGVDAEKIVVIPNGVNTELFRPIDGDRCREELGLRTSPIITFVGAFRPYQGLEYAVQAMPHVLKHFPSAKLMLIGYSSGRFKPSIEDLRALADSLQITENVILTGKVPHHLIPLYINASDICIAPLVKGRLGSPIKIFEYMACGKPVLTTEVEQFKELIEGNGLGIVVEPGDSEAIAKGIIKLLSNGRIRENMGRKAGTFVLNNFTWEKTAVKLLDIFNDLVR